MVNADRIGDVVAVYVAENGETKVSHDLREGNKEAEKSIYPVHTAIGITVSDTLLLGCTPVLVEGPSDQVYLIAVKNYLSKIGKYRYGSIRQTPSRLSNTIGAIWEHDNEKGCGLVLRGEV